VRLAAGASGSHRWSKTGNAVGYVWLSQPIIRPRRPQRTAQQTLSLRSALFAARACRVQEHVQHTRVVVQRGAAVLRCALRGSAACAVSASLHLRLRLTSAPPRPGPPRLTGTQAAQPPATMRTHRANARAISLRIRAAAREPALSRIHNSSSCRVPLSPREGASSPDQHHRIGSQRSNAQLITSPVAREPADPSFI